MEFCTNPPIPHPIHLQLKHQPRTLNPHIQREIQIIKLHSLRCRQPREQTLRHRIKIRSKRANRYEPLAIGVRCGFEVAGDEVIFDDEGLAGPEVACVVEGYRG